MSQRFGFRGFGVVEFRSMALGEQTALELIKSLSGDGHGTEQMHSDDTPRMVPYGTRCRLQD